MKGRALGIYESSHEPPSKTAEEHREKLDPEDWAGVWFTGHLPLGVESEHRPRARNPIGSRGYSKHPIRPIAGPNADFAPPRAASPGSFLKYRRG